MKIRIVGLFFLTFLSLCATAQDIFQVNKDLGRGVNMGNMFEAPSEGEWGNPFRDDYFQRIADLGFDHVRIPIRWDVEARADLTAPYAIKPEFMTRIKSVVDMAQAAGLKAIINMHHHDAIFDTPESIKPRYLAQWEQIAEAFKDYDANLLFEPLNEPHGNLSPELWNGYFAEALAVIRETNPTRAVLMGIANFGGLSGVPKILFPDGEEHVILSIHYYEPFRFTHQGAEWVDNTDPWLGTKWTNTDLEQKAVESQFKFAINFAKENNVPINIGEFGAYSKADLESRELWTTFMARWFEERGFSWAYWEFSAGFGIFNPQTNTYVQPLVDALLKNPFPTAVVTETNVVYESDFESGESGWNLQTQGNATATFTVEDGNALINVSVTDTDAWKVQLVQSDILLEKGKQYLVTFNARAVPGLSVTTYLGQSADPWGGYSAFNSISISSVENEYQFTFEMTGETDPKARFVFDLGGTRGVTFLNSLKVEEVVDGTEEEEQEIVLATEIENGEINVYPNPTAKWLKISSQIPIDEVNIYDVKGVLRQTAEVVNNAVELNQNLSAGVYFIKMKEKEKIWTKRLLIK